MKTEFEVVEELYLVVRVASKFEEEKNIDARLSKGNRYVGVMNHLCARSETVAQKFKIYETILTPIALYVFESWVLIKNAQEALRRWEGKMIIRKILG